VPCVTPIMSASAAALRASSWVILSGFVVTV
jgi:hypothetical protein